MGFQYDNDDLGYEWGYDKPANSSTEIKQSLQSTPDTPNLAYECQNICPPGLIQIGTGTDGMPLCGPDEKPTKPAAETQKTEDKKEAKKADDKKSGVQPPPPKPEPDGQKAARAKAEQAKAQEAQKPATPAKAADSTPAKGSPEAAMENAPKTLTGKNPNVVADEIASTLSKNTEDKGWGAKIQTHSSGKQSIVVRHAKSGKTLTYIGDKDKGSETWKLEGGAEKKSTEDPAKTKKIVEVRASAEAALKGKSTKNKDDIKKALGRSDWTVNDDDIKEDGTVTATHKEAGKFTFKIGDKGVETLAAPKAVTPHHSEPKPSQSPEELALESDYIKAGAKRPTIQEYEKETFPPLEKHAERKEHVKKEKATFANYLQNPANKEKGQEYLREGLKRHYVNKIREKIGKEETLAALKARGFQIEQVTEAGQTKDKVIGRKQSDGTIRALNDSDISDLENLNKQVYSEAFNPEEFKTDTARREVVNAWLDQVVSSEKDPVKRGQKREEATRVLMALQDSETGEPYLNEKGEPTKFKIENFKTTLFQGFADGKQSPTSQQLAPFAKIFSEYQTELQGLENARVSLKKAHADGHLQNRTVESIDKEYSEKEARLKADFDKKMKKTLDSADPMTREYVQEQLRNASYYKDGKPQASWNADFFAETIVAPSFTEPVKEYQKALEANEKSRQDELLKYKADTDKVKIKEINEKHDKKAVELKEKLDKKIHDQLMSADPITLKCITEKLQSAGYYKKSENKEGVLESVDSFRVETNWTKEKQNQFLENTSPIKSNSIGVAKSPDQAKINYIEKMKLQAEKDLEKNKDDPDKLREISDKLQKKIDNYIEKSDPVTKASLQQMAAQNYVNQVHDRLTKAYGFTDGDARAIERSWGLIDHMDGKVSPKVQANVPRERFEYLIGANKGGVTPPRSEIIRNAVKSYRQDLPVALGKNTNLGGENIAKGMQGKGYFGTTDKYKPGTLDRMAKDLDRVETAKDKGDQATLGQVSQEYQSSAQGVALPAVGSPEGNQALIAQSKADQAGQTGETSSTTATGDEKSAKQEGASASNATTPTGKAGKGKKESAQDKQLAQQDRHHKEGREDTNKKLGLERDSLNLNRERLQFDKDEAKAKRLQEAERLEFEREKLEVEKEKVETDRAFQASENKKNRDAQMLQAMLTSAISFLASLLQAAMGMLGQVVAAQSQQVVASIQVSQAPRGR